MTWTRAFLCWVLAALLGSVWMMDAPVAATVAAPASDTSAPAEVNPPLVPSPIRSVEIRRGDARVAWERDGDRGWRVTAPEGRGIPSGLLDAFTEQLATVGSGERIEGGGGDPAFGLDPPALTVVAGGEGGERVSLAIGARTPTGTAIYARVDGSGTVLLAGLNFLYYADLLLDAAR